MSTLLEIGIKSVGLIAFAGLVAFLLRNRSASVRHRIWALSFVGLAALPLLSLRLPEIQVVRPAEPYSQKPTHLAASTFVPPIPANVSLHPSPSPFPTPGDSPTPSVLPSLLVTVWIFGTAVLLGRTGLQLFALARLGKEGVDVATSEAPPHTRVVRSSATGVPMTFGFLRPTILLPLASKDWPEARLRAVLLHESAHVARGDWAWLVFCRIVATLYWPNPLVLWATLKLRVEGELAADNAVLQKGVDAPNYAATLVDLAEGLMARPATMALPFVEPSSLKSRITSILKGVTPRQPLSKAAAVSALVFGLAVVVPYAAVHLVQGPETIRDGVIDLVGGHRVEVVAITEMRGNLAISWDVRGALLRRSLGVGKEDQANLQLFEPPQPFMVAKHTIGSPLPSPTEVRPEFSGGIIRYVILRADSEADFPEFLRQGGENASSLGYSGPRQSINQSFGDALGGRYRIIRIDAPAESKTSSLQARIPVSDWKLYAYTNYKKGEEQASLNPTAHIHIAPMMPSRGKGTEVSFILPSDFSDQVTTARIFPLDTDGSSTMDFSGPEMVQTRQLPEEITRIEVLSRPLKTVVLADLPLQPDPGVAYQPHHYLPDGMTVANHGTAQLPSGATVGINTVALVAPDPLGKPHLIQGWDSDGKPSGEKMVSPPSMLFAKDLPEVGKKLIGLQIDAPNQFTSDWQGLFDEEGWPLLVSYQSIFNTASYSQDYVGAIDQSVPHESLSMKVAAGPYQPFIQLKRSTKGIRWNYTGKALHIDFPPEIIPAVASRDSTIKALDANGHEVTGPVPGEGATYDQTAAWVEFNLVPAVADRVKTIQIQTRPYNWVRFPNVALEPRKG